MRVELILALIKTMIETTWSKLKMVNVVNVNHFVRPAAALYLLVLTLISTGR